MSSFTPQQRVLRARLAALSRWSQEDPRLGTEKARRASPGQLEYWLERQPPEPSQSERMRRAECAKRAHFARLALASAQARRARKAGR